MKKGKKNIRLNLLALLLAVVLGGYSLQLVSWQLIHRDSYRSVASATATYTASISAARGEILDRYGRPLAVNTESFNITFDRAYLPGNQLNDTILTLTKLLSSTGEGWTDSIPLAKDAPYEFTEEAKVSLASLRSLLGLAHYATAENCFQAMINRYLLEDYTTSQQRTIMGVRAMMELAGYSDSKPYTFAENVSMETITKIEESSFALPGVVTEVVPIRQYVAGTIAPHIIGTVGPIYAEEWEQLKQNGYSYDDKVGKSGIEKVAEQTLRGQDGEKVITRGSDGQVVSTQITKQPQNGNTVFLTIDKYLQQKAQEALEKRIRELQGTEDAAYANAGAVVVLNVNTGDVLAAVTYPSYTMETYQNDYSSLLSASAKPLFNRALSGTYAPGSTFKPATALIGLSTGVITSSDTINCVHRYTYYDDYQPSCLGRHGHINVITAISKSCNYFFYDLGRRVGINTMNEYCRKFGLGVSTGIEISEAGGILAGKEYRKSIGSYWVDGDTLQAAIGQSDNLFTPLQMAVYTSTIANNGTRYKASIIRKVMNYALSETISETEPTVLDQSGIPQSAYDVVKQGMLKVTTEGTAAALNNYPIDIGGKTGTATVYEKSVEYNNAVFIAFAPYDEPEIAVAIVGEKCGHGNAMAPVAQAVFDAYFFYQGQAYHDQPVNTLLP